jgi:alkylhydroperoxidase family enzyme
MFDGDIEGMGYVANVSRLWAHLPAALNDLADLMGRTVDAGGLSPTQRAVLVTSTAATLGDSYCSMAWGKRLADETSPHVAAAVIGGELDGLEVAEQALARWAQLVTRNPNGITVDDVQALRDTGYDDSQIFGITAFVALRMAFSTVNDALGAVPDLELLDSLPEPLRAAVAFGRHPDRAEDGDHPAADSGN